MAHRGKEDYERIQV